MYSMLDYREHKQRKAEAAAAAEKNASPDVAAAYTLFTTKTCPNCKAAKAILDRAGIKYDVVDAEDEPELALRYGVMQVPALVVVSFGENGSGNRRKAVPASDLSTALCAAWAVNRRRTESCSKVFGNEIISTICRRAK